jgi:hypothetical protein
MENTTLYKAADATYNPALDEEVEEPYFSQKLEEAAALYQKYAVPATQKSQQKNGSPQFTSLQKELLEAYALEPTDEQMTALKDFLAQLFATTPPIRVEEQEQVLELAA